VKTRELEACPFAAEGRHIRSLRQARGLSRNELARKLKVDVSSLAGWEAGKRLPRDAVRTKLARALDCDLSQLLAPDTERSEPVRAALVDIITELPALLTECTRTMKSTLRAVRLASPYPTAAFVQTEWRALLHKRIMSGEVQVQRFEIFYDLKRLQETLSNIMRYHGRHYYVKSFSAHPADILPLFSLYAFDDADFLVGGYWSTVPPQDSPGLRLSGSVFGKFFAAYWAETWRRGTLLNLKGANDLSAVKELAIRLGLNPRRWERFVAEARELEVGDGAPPLI